MPQRPADPRPFAPASVPLVKLAKHHHAPCRPLAPVVVQFRHPHALCRPPAPAVVRFRHPPVCVVLRAPARQVLLALVRVDRQVVPVDQVDPAPVVLARPWGLRAPVVQTTQLDPARPRPVALPRPVVAVCRPVARVVVLVDRSVRRRVVAVATWKSSSQAR